ncbi:MAG TPA: hypothetical protein VHN78_02700, partial [Chloroflexota bacterium]|nr:hypothetical protein [Chloroflexota bacterium]
AGAGQGGTIIAVHPEPASLEGALVAAGARRILYPQPQEGVRLEQGLTERALAAAPPAIAEGLAAGELVGTVAQVSDGRAVLQRRSVP